MIHQMRLSVVVVALGTFPKMGLLMWNVNAIRNKPCQRSDLVKDLHIASLSALACQNRTPHSAVLSILELYCNFLQSFAADFAICAL